MIVKVFNTKDGRQATIVRGNDMEDKPDLRIMKEEGDDRLHNMGVSFSDCEEGHCLRDMVFMSVNSLEDLDALMEMGLDDWIKRLMVAALADAVPVKAGRPH